MGVKGLWSTLNPIKENISVSSLRGKVLAVDLAIWVVQSETVTNNVYDYIYLRQTFFKINHLLEHGIGIVIVTDGKAPHLKALTIAKRLGVDLDRNNKIVQRRRFMKIMKECETLAKSLGITVLKGECEAEAAAAKLQQDGFVDGVITTDGDAFVYGARKVYRNLLVTETQCQMYDMNRVERELGLTRDDMIGMAVLNGCDYNPDGISGLGRKTIKEYILSREKIRTVPEELISWCGQVTEILQRHEGLTALKSKPHCAQCKHPGSKKQHSKSGCSMCPDETCSAPATTPVICTCTKHAAQRLLATPQMQCCVKFVKHVQNTKLPVKQIVEEFSNSRPNAAVSPQWNLPACSNFTTFMHEKLEWRQKVSAEKFGHVAALHHVSQKLEYNRKYPVIGGDVVRFEGIKKRRRKDKVDMFELTYSILDPKLSEILQSETVSAILDAEFVEFLLPEAVTDFVECEGEKREKIGGKKREGKENEVIVEEGELAEELNSMKKLVHGIESLTMDEKRAPLGNITSRVVGSVNRNSSSDSETKTKKFENPSHTTDENSLITQPMEENAGNRHVDSDSDDDEEYVPLCTRIAMRRAQKHAEEEGKTEVDSENVSPRKVSREKVEPYEISDDHDEIPDRIPVPVTNDSSTQTPIRGHESDPLSELVTSQQRNDISNDEYFDSDIQLLPQNFVGEYLDLTNEDVSFQENKKGSNSNFSSPSKIPRPSLDNSDNLPAFSDLLNKSQNSFTDELSQKLVNLSQSLNNMERITMIGDRNKDYHQFFFSTPHEKKDDRVRNRDGEEIERACESSIGDAIGRGSEENNNQCFDVSSFEFEGSVVDNTSIERDANKVEVADKIVLPNLSLVCSSAEPSIIGGFSPIASSHLNNTPLIQQDEQTSVLSIDGEHPTYNDNDNPIVISDSSDDSIIAGDLSTVLGCGQFSPSSPSRRSIIDVGAGFDVSSIVAHHSTPIVSNKEKVSEQPLPPLLSKARATERSSSKSIVVQNFSDFDSLLEDITTSSISDESEIGESSDLIGRPCFEINVTELLES